MEELKEAFGPHAAIIPYLLDEGVEGIPRMRVEMVMDPKTVKSRKRATANHPCRCSPKIIELSKIQCKNCKEFGHSLFKCNKPPREVPEEEDKSANRVEIKDSKGLTWNRTLVFLGDRWHLSVTFFRDEQEICHSIHALPEDVSNWEGPTNPLLDPFID